MTRYIALAQNGTTSAYQQRQFAKFEMLMKQKAGWTCADASDRLIVFCHAEGRKKIDFQRLHGDQGIVLGKVFRNSRTAVPASPHTFRPAEIEGMHSSQGQSLIDSFWGRYVALLSDNHRQRIVVVRDPTGAIPCFTAIADGMVLVFSHIEDAIDSELYQPEVNWSFISTFLLYPRLETGETGLSGISELQGGESLQIGGGRTHSSLLWNPARICASDSLDDSGSAMLELKQSVAGCVRTWGTNYSNILHQLSGGLDSAIVLGFLREVVNRDDLACINFYSPGIPESDERNYARIVSEHFDSELIEAELNYIEKIQDLFELPGTAKPSFSVYGLGNDRLLAQVAKDRGIDAFSSGSGGDQLFFQLHTPLVAADYVQRHGVDKKFFQIAFDVAQLIGKPVWTVFRSAIAHGLLRRSTNPYLFITEREHFLSEDVRLSIREQQYSHRWLQDKKEIPGGKLAQVAVIADCFTYFGPYQRNQYADSLNPLVSQPVIETCLRIPSYIYVEGGIDRALARGTFSDSLPKQIVSRTSKGSTGRVVKQVLTRNLDFVEDLLMNGTLIREGLLDRKKLEEFFSEEHRVKLEKVIGLMGAMCTEIWVSKWMNGRGRRAA